MQAGAPEYNPRDGAGGRRVRIRSLTSEPASAALTGTRPLPAFYKIDKDLKLVLTTASGVLTLADSLSHQDRLSKDADFSPEFSQLMDLTHVTEVALTGEDIDRLAKATVFSPDSRRAILVNDDVKFGLARMFETFRDIRGEKGIRVFHNLRDALAWVLATEEEINRTSSGSESK